MKKTFILLGFFFLFVRFSVAFGQLEASNWFFGNHAGLDFDPPPVVPQAGGQVNIEEGCSAISDCSGDLLFYSDGIRVWDANHSVMPNGNGLMGNPSSSQSGLIVPRPGAGNEHLFYVFTVDDANGSNGLRYSVVDMNLNGGTGAVVSGQKNILLINNVEEKVTAIQNFDQDFFWVVTLGPAPSSGTSIPINTYIAPRNTIYAIKVDNTGINTNVVASTIQGLSFGRTHGYMKISPQGDKIGLAGYYDEELYLLDFDVNTGVASNYRVLSKPPGFMPYGIEFSPDGRFMYVFGDSSSSRVYLLQYDLQSNNLNYTNLLPSSATGYRGALQLGIDGKIYIAESFSYSTGTNTLSTIDNPNEQGAAANVNRFSVSLPSGMVCRQGLPQFIQSFFVQIAVTDENNVNTNAVCSGETVSFSVESNKTITQVDWDFGDGNTLTSYPSPSNPTQVQVQHDYSISGSFTVTSVMYFADGCHVTRQITIEVLPLPQIQTVTPLEVCDINRNGIASFNLHSKDSEVIGTQPAPGTYSVQYYETQADAETQTNEISDPYTNTTPYSQTVYYVLTNGNTGCSDIGTLELTVNPLPEIFPVTTPLELCDDDFDGLAQFNLHNAEPEILNGRTSTDYTIVFYETQSDAENQTNPITNPSSYENTTPGTQEIYYTIMNNDTECVNVGSFEVVVNPKPEILMDNLYIVCPGDSVYVEAPAGFVSYQWNTGASGQGIYVSTPGNYSVEVTDDKGCQNSKDITVEISEPAVIDSVLVTHFNGNDNSIEVIVSGNGDYEYSLDDVSYQDSNVFTNLYPGDYTVYVNDKNGCGKVQVEVKIIGAPPFFTPNNDGYNDYWQVINIEARPGSVIRIFDRYGKKLYEMSALDRGWDGNYNGIPQPSDDYWYYIELVEPDSEIRIVTGHFSLIR